jgi:hypothetical protein
MPLRGDQHGGEHQPLRNLIVGAIVRPAETPSPKPSAVECDHVRICQGDRPLRRCAGRDRIGQGSHADKHRPTGRPERLIRLEHDRKFHDLFAGPAGQRAGAKPRSDTARERMDGDPADGATQENAGGRSKLGFGLRTAEAIMAIDPARKCPITFDQFQYKLT